jgi:hypothetical protein
MTLHPDDVDLWDKASQFAINVASRFGFDLRIVEPKRRPTADGAYGLCYVWERRIAVVIRFRDLQRNGGQWWKKPLPWKDIENTIIHEICHLPHPRLKHNGKVVRGVRYLPDNQQHRQLQAAVRALLREDHNV